MVADLYEVRLTSYLCWYAAWPTLVNLPYVPAWSRLGWTVIIHRAQKNHPMVVGDAGKVDGKIVERLLNKRLLATRYAR